MVAVYATAAGESGRWVGHWMIESREVDTPNVEEDTDADADLVDLAVPEADFSGVFATPPREFLVDAEDLLSPRAATERLEFLRHHANDSNIDLYVYLFNTGSEIPADPGVERFFSEQPNVVVFYFMGEPQRAGVYFSPSLADVVSEAEQLRSLQGAVMQAAGNAEAEAQFEAFLTQISIRLYWMERMIDSGVVESVIAAEPIADAAKAKEGFFSNIRLPADGLPWIGAGVFVAVALPGIWWMRRLRARYRFPEFDIEPRLGGKHAAGVGAVISYLSPNLSPIAQREQTTDFSRDA